MIDAPTRVGTLEKCVTCRKYSNNVHLVDGVCPTCRSKKRPGARARAAAAKMAAAAAPESA